MGKLQERLYDLFHYTPLKDGIKRTSKEIKECELSIENLKIEIESTKRQLFYLNGLKKHILSNIVELNAWKKELNNKLKDEYKEKIVENSLL